MLSRRRNIEAPYSNTMFAQLKPLWNCLSSITFLRKSVKNNRVLLVVVHCLAVKIFCISGMWREFRKQLFWISR